MKRTKVTIGLMCFLLISILFAFPIWAREKTHTYGNIPPASVIEKGNIEELTVPYSEKIPNTATSANAQVKATPGWVQVGTGWKYLLPNGSYATNTWLQVGDKWYHFDSMGFMQEGWFQDTDGNWYYLIPGDGYMAVGWVQVNNKWYYLGSNGIMMTGLQEINGERYFLDQSQGGAMLSDSFVWIGPVADAQNRNLYFHFNSSGAADFISDTEPCADMYYTFNDYKYLSMSDPIEYFYSEGIYKDQVSNGVNMWTQAHGINFKHVNTPATFAFQEKKLENNTVGQTVTYYNNTETNFRRDWNIVNIYLATNQSGLVSSGVVAHEMGHGFGMSHRYYDKTSIMYPFTESGSYGSISFDDIDTYDDIYEN